MFVVVVVVVLVTVQWTTRRNGVVRERGTPMVQDNKCDDIMQEISMEIRNPSRDGRPRKAASPLADGYLATKRDVYGDTCIVPK